MEFRYNTFSLLKKYFENINERLTIRDKRYKKKEILGKIFREVLNTPSCKCNSDAKTEIHSLTAHHHLFMYITAIKSLLRYYDNIALVVHDDGSLTYQDSLLLKKHIAGIRIENRKEADIKMEKMLNGFPSSRKYRRNIINSMELFDNILLSGSDKIITMNSDVLFLSEPHELINWICNGTGELMSVYEEQPKNQKEFLAEHACTFPPHVTICLTCLYKSVFNFDVVENALADSNPDWFTGQNMYPLLFSYKHTEYPLSFFNKKTYQASGVFSEGATFRHYWTSTGSFISVQTIDSSRMISEFGRI